MKPLKENGKQISPSQRSGALFFIGAIVIALFIPGHIQAQSADSKDPIKQMLELTKTEPEEAYKQKKQADQQQKRTYDFIKAAFSYDLWLENSASPSESLIPYQGYIASSHSGMKKSWAYEYINREEDLPESGHIYKWNKPVDISLGWPQYGVYSAPSVEKNEAYSIVKDQIIKLMPDLESLTDLPFEFVEPDDSREKTENYARIRIILEPRTGLANHFKFLNYDRSRKSGHTFEDILLTSFVGAVPFAPYAKSQVEGFLLPNPDGSIGVAICRILDRLPASMIRALVSECLVRAMGFPGLISGRDDTLLSDWNRAHDEQEKTEFEDGSSALFFAYHLDYEERSQAFYRSFKEVINLDPYYTLSSYDKELISLLYCRDIKPGDNRNRTIVTLMTDGNCN